MDSYKERRKKMGFGRNTDLKSYENIRMEAEKSWVSSEVQIWTLWTLLFPSFMKKEEKR